MMTMKTFWRSTTALAVSAALLPVFGNASAAAQGVNEPANDSERFILPFHGDINPFHGDINPFHGDINPFYGDISPFWGDISPFWGDISPFHGDINPFHGDISPFWGDIEPFHGDINPFWGDIEPFWGDIGPFWGDINAFWGDIAPFEDASAGEYDALADQLTDLFSRAESVFGPTIADRTGSNFRDGFLNGLLAEYGFDPSDPQSLETVDAEQRARFFLDFYDGLMSYSGIDHVDHWMPAVTWSPALAQSVGNGDGVVVGMLDFSLQSDGGIDIRTSQGERDWLDMNHGAAVASLIAAPLDGAGVMGVAPEATLVTYNPFDETLSSNWTDVSEGVRRLVQQQASVINMSLGIPGWTFHQEWANVLSDRRVAVHADDALFVIAAGNDGVTQTADVDWSAVGDVSNLIVVGSVDPTGRISSFSNRPGEACLTVNGQCGEGFRLMDRFLVAPGELILASDGEGGVTRLTGTSFAAPLVSGAAALVQGRWGWLDAGNVADVLLLSATDLGEQGVDATYGRGLLDVEGALSPLDSGDLFAVDANGNEKAIRELGLTPGRLQVHTGEDGFITLFEPLGDTYRDFRVSLADLMASSELSDEQRASITEIYLAERARNTGEGGAGFADTYEAGRVMSRTGALTVTAFAAARDPYQRSSSRDLPFQAGIEIADTVDGRSLRLGSGEGALALNRDTGFQLFSDHRPETGGVNPVLGFASGGAYLLSSWRVSADTRMTVGFSATHDSRDFVNPFTGEETPVFAGMPAYSATAMVADIRHTMTDRFEVSATYTHLDEATGFLGAQGSGPLSFAGGARTDAVTVGAEAALPASLRLSVSATAARTQAGRFGDSLMQLSEDAMSTAFQVTALREGVFAEGDAVRFSLVQPLHLEDGTLTFNGSVVTDRTTGEIGPAATRWDLGGERAVYSELLYALPVFGDRADLSVFGRTSLSGNALAQTETALASGLRFDLRF
ncbi:MAG: S8 family peptidase [Pseudomonadota bacterium]|nr:S8 family peptidase [Pseudomonadota bacterium]